MTELSRFNDAIKINDLKLVKILHKEYFNIISPYLPKLLNTAISFGYLDIVTYLSDHTPFDTKALAHAAMCGHLHIIKYIQSTGYIPTRVDIIMYRAALSDSLPLIQYLVSCNYKCIPEMMDVAVFHGRLDIVKYLHKINAPVTSNVFNIAIDNNRNEIANYLLDNNLC